MPVEGASRSDADIPERSEGNEREPSQWLGSKFPAETGEVPERSEGNDRSRSEGRSFDEGPMRGMQLAVRLRLDLNDSAVPCLYGAP